MDADTYRGIKSCICCCLLMGTIAFDFMAFSFARIERTKIDTYLKTDCLVTSSSFEKCGITRTDHGDQQCIRLNWQIEYTRYQSNKQATVILEFSFLKKLTDLEDRARRDLANHRIGQTYLCYHSPTNRSTEVQWEQPSVEKYTISMIIGIGLLLLSIIILVFIIYTVFTVCCGYDCPPRIPQCCRVSRVRNTSRRRDQHVHLNRSQAYRTPTILLEEENFPLTSAPPPYVASGDSMENERIPSPSPPPYVPSSASIENENIPSSPPPAYVRSSSV